MKTPVLPPPAVSIKYERPCSACIHLPGCVRNLFVTWRVGPEGVVIVVGDDRDVQLVELRHFYCAVSRLCPSHDTSCHQYRPSADGRLEKISPAYLVFHETPPSPLYAMPDCRRPAPRSPRTPSTGRQRGRGAYTAPHRRLPTSRPMREPSCPATRTQQWRGRLRSARSSEHRPAGSHFSPAGVGLSIRCLIFLTSGASSNNRRKRIPREGSLAPR